MNCEKCNYKNDCHANAEYALKEQKDWVHPCNVELRDSLKEKYEIGSIVEIIKVKEDFNTIKINAMNRNKVTIIKDYELLNGEIIGYVLESDKCCWWLHEELKYICHIEDTEDIE